MGKEYPQEEQKEFKGKLYKELTRRNKKNGSGAGGGFSRGWEEVQEGGGGQGNMRGRAGGLSNPSTPLRRGQGG